MRAEDGRAILIVGTVLPWLSDTRHSPLRGAEAFCARLGEQAAEWRALASAHPDAALCVAGDFNQDLAERHYYGSATGRTALRRALDDAELRCLTGGARDPLLRYPGQASVDHICVSTSLVADADVAVGSWPEPPLSRGRLTDHFGVYADLPVPPLR